MQANATRQVAFDELEAMRSQSKSLTAQLEAIENEKKTAIQDAEWPVPGLSLDDEGVILNGLPLESASKSQRTIASTKIGMALNPKLRLLVCEDGSDLDTETIAALDAMLKENDFQMLLEVVTRTEEDRQMCAVIIDGGVVASSADETETQPQTEEETK